MFIQKYIEMLANWPVTTVVFSACVLAIVIHAVVPSWYGIRNMLLSYWSRGMAKTDNPYVKLLSSAGKGRIGGEVEDGDITYTLRSGGAMFFWKHEGRYNMGFNPSSTYSGGHSNSTSNYKKYKTEEDALKDMQDFLVNVYMADAGDTLFAYWMGLILGTITITLGSLVLDYLLVNHFTLLCIFGLAALVLLIVTKGGRYVYDINAKVDKIDALTRGEENATD